MGSRLGPAEGSAWCCMWTGSSGKTSGDWPREMRDTAHIAL